MYYIINGNNGDPWGLLVILPLVGLIRRRRRLSYSRMVEGIIIIIDCATEGGLHKWVSLAHARTLPPTRWLTAYLEIEM